MKVGRGFTLIELLISLSLGSFVMLGMMQTYRGVMRYLERSRSMMETNRQVCLLFNQIERDFSTAYIPNLHEVVQESKNQEKQQQAVAKQDDKKKKAEEKKKRQKTFFMASLDEQAPFEKINGKRKKQFKEVNFICTHPFQIYGQKQVRLVRVAYQLVLNKKVSTNEANIYQLWRKETANVLNSKFQEEEAGKNKTSHIKKYMIADNIKSMVLEFVTFKETDKAKTPAAGQPPQEITLQTWGDKKETEGVVPRSVRLWIDFWNDRRDSAIRFHALFPVYVYPTDTEEEKKDEAKEREEPGGTQEQKQADGQLSARPNEADQVAAQGQEGAEQVGTSQLQGNAS